MKHVEFYGRFPGFVYIVISFDFKKFVFECGVFIIKAKRARNGDNERPSHFMFIRKLQMSQVNSNRNV